MCDLILAVLGRVAGSLEFKAVMRGFRSSGKGLESEGTGGSFKTCLHQRFKYAPFPALAPPGGRKQ